MELLTERLRLRPLRPEDADRFAAMNTDPAVMEHFPAPLTRAESDRLLGVLIARRQQAGLAFGAVEWRDRPGLIGMAGLSRPGFTAPFTPCVEVGWRLVPQVWGQGVATEAARALLAHGFGPLGLAEIVSFTAEGNLRSQAVMRRAGMQEDPGGAFDHPALPGGHRLRRHVLWRLTRETWEGRA